MEITLDRKRGREVLGNLLAHARAGTLPYRIEEYLPQRRVPQEILADKVTCALFFFYVCHYMRGGIKSETAIVALVEVWREHPDLFIPHRAAALPSEVIGECLKRHVGGWDIAAVQEFWKENSHRLAKLWQGNPLLLFRGVRNYEELAQRIKNNPRPKAPKRIRIDGKVNTKGGEWPGFLGFQYKMTSMLVYFYVAMGLVEISFPPPVDFHHLRIFLAHEILVVRGNKTALRYGERLQKPIRSFLTKYSRKSGATDKEIADLLWTYSLVMCATAPGNIVVEERGRSPQGQPEKKNPEPRLIEGAELKITPRVHAMRLCAQCPVVRTCRYDIPANPYYRAGILDLRPHEKDLEVVKLIEGHTSRLLGGTPPTADTEYVQQILL